MAYDRPSLKELWEQTERDFSSKFYGTAAQLRRGTLKTLARVWAGLVNGANGYIDWAYRNFFATTADNDQLERHGAEIGIYRKAATFASGNVVFTGDEGGVIPEGALLQSLDGAYQYQTIGELTIPESGTITSKVTANEAGASWNASGGTLLEFSSPLSNVDDNATIGSEGLSGGADLESDDDLRSRILFKKQNPPQGYSVADYVIMATSVQPVTDAFIFPQFPQANSVTVVCANYNVEPPVLTNDEIAVVDEYLKRDDIKEVTTDVQTTSVVPRLIDVNARIKPNTEQNRASANQELKDLFLREGTPGKTVFASAVSAAIGNVPAITGVELVELKQDNQVVQDLELDFKGIAFLNLSTYLDL